MAVDTQQLSKVMLSDESGAASCPEIALRGTFSVSCQHISGCHFTDPEVWVFNVGVPEC